MSLPFVLEIAVGLIFIYLTLSLVASEIQEILSTLFQWRAEHLKRSIEQLLEGEGPYHNEATPSSTGTSSSRATFNREAARSFADELYSSPLIEDLNYEAKGRLTGLLRRLLHGIGTVYRTLTFSRNVFGEKTSGPSYIPAETFATSLVERLRLEDFQRLLARSRFNTFLHTEVQRPLHNIINELRARLHNEELLTAETTHFDQATYQISTELVARRLSLATALEQVMGQLQSFENMAADAPLIEAGASPEMVQTFLNRLRYLRIGLSGQAQDNAALLARLQPTLSDLTQLLDPNNPNYIELVNLAKQEGDAAWSALDNLQQAVIPPRLRNSLSTLASRAEIKVEAAGSEIQQFQREIESWFNNGMERASGVYRRNVKGVGLMVGFAIAFIINADTLYMFQRLSTDQAIRNSILQTADQIEVRNIDTAEALAEELSVNELSDRLEGNFRSIGTALEDTLSAYPLPLGRAQALMDEQKEAQKNWPVPILPKRLIGWGITALALSMGASFWFDLLRKVTSVRASGDRPKS